MDDSLHLLLVEDDVDLASTLIDWLRAIFRRPASVWSVHTLAEAIQRLHQSRIDVVLLDLNLPDSQELATLRAIIQQAPQVPCIVMTGLPEEDHALAAIRAGAEDFIPKPVLSEERLRTSILYAIERHRRIQAHDTQLGQVATSLRQAAEGGRHGEA